MILSADVLGQIELTKDYIAELQQEYSNWLDNHSIYPTCVVTAIWDTIRANQKELKSLEEFYNELEAKEQQSILNAEIEESAACPR